VHDSSLNWFNILKSSLAKNSETALWLLHALKQILLVRFDAHSGDLMDQGSKNTKPITYGFVVFVTLGISIANETLFRFTMENTFVFIFSVALVFAACMLASRIWLATLVLLGINLPETVLL